MQILIPILFKFQVREKNEPHTTTAQSSATRLYRCNQCEESFPKLSEFRVHNCLRGTKHCEFCDLTFANLKALQLHMKLHEMETDSDQLRAFVCEVCGTEFSTHKSLRLHSRMHAPVRARHVDAPEGTQNSTFTCFECGENCDLFSLILTILISLVL